MFAKFSKLRMISDLTKATFWIGASFLITAAFYIGGCMMTVATIYHTWQWLSS